MAFIVVTCQIFLKYQDCVKSQFYVYKCCLAKIFLLLEETKLRSTNSLQNVELAQSSFLLVRVFVHLASFCHSELVVIHVYILSQTDRFFGGWGGGVLQLLMLELNVLYCIY